MILHELLHKYLTALDNRIPLKFCFVNTMSFMHKLFLWLGFDIYNLEGYLV